MPNNNNDFRSLMRRARWDRLIGALIVLLLLLHLIVSAVKSITVREPKETNKVIEPATEPATVPADAVPDVLVDNSMAVFLSPSTQEDNAYACDETITEEIAMFELAEKVKALLEADGYVVYMCGEDDNVKRKVTTGNELKCGAYVALHSNAGGESGTDEGTECYYNSTVPGSLELAENIYNRVAEFTPTVDRGLKDETERELYEILNNETPCCLLEVEFHDTEPLSQWILDNQDGTAKCIKDGIVAFLNSQSASSMPVETDAESDDDDYNLEAQE